MKRNRLRVWSWFSLIFLLVPGGPASAKEELRYWDMEDRIAASQLILVGRVSNVSAMTVVHGGKATSTLREYRFQPVRRLKGVFSRDELALTSSDLGVYEEDSSTVPPLQQGEFRLLLLARTREGFSCVSGSQGNLPPEYQVPQLGGAEDSLVGVVQTLIEVTGLPSRKARAELLLTRLREVSGQASLPLLWSLNRRTLWAAQTPGVEKSLARLATDESADVREATAEALAGVLTADYRKDDKARLAVLAEAVQQLLGPQNRQTAVRVPALRALGQLGEIGRQKPGTIQLLRAHLENAPTYAERMAAASALADLHDPKTGDVILRALARLPLDAPPHQEQLLAEAGARLDRPQAVVGLMRRVEEKRAADLSPLTEINQLGILQARDAVPLLLDVAKASMPGRQSHGSGANVRRGYRYAWNNSSNQQVMVLARAFEQIKDARSVALLAEWLRSPIAQVRDQSFAALAAIDNDEAVAAVRLRLKAEPNLHLKLRMAGMLGRHGIQDGYPFAIEHIADSGHTEVAAAALGAMHNEHTEKELWGVLEASHDRSWNGAALVGLAAVRDPKIAARIRQILREPRHALLTSAAAAAGELGDPTLLAALKPLVLSRNPQVAQASLQAVARIHKTNTMVPQNQAPWRDVARAVIEVLSDPDSNAEIRLTALATLKVLGDERRLATLKQLADHAELEQSPLLAEVENELREARVPLDG